MLKPKKRFSEFKDPLQQSRLGDIAIFLKGKGISKNDIVINGINECIRYGELYTTYGELISKVSSKTNISKSVSILSEINDIIIPSSGESQLDIAKASCVLVSGVILGGDLNIIRMRANGVFFSYYLNSAKKIEIAKIAQGNSVVHLYSRQLSNLIVNYPSPPEQQKIASFLSSVDEKINLLKKQLTLLEQYKKGVMQKIFSREICFKDDDGKEFPEWEEKRLGEICKITTGKLDANSMIENGKYRFYTCAKNYFKIDRFAFDTEALLISGNGANVGYIHYYKGKFNAYQRTYVLERFREDIQYIKFYLQKYLSLRINNEKKEGNTPYIVLSTLSHMMLGIPSIIEQQKIASFLSSIDEKIDYNKNQIRKMESWKKGLLQQMFI
jgi:type I restriction enzyme S subunit